MATYTVTTTQDTDAALRPAPADASGSLRAAVDAANAAGGGAITAALPAGSTIALLSRLPDLTGAVSLDFGTGGFTLTSSAAGSAARPYGGLMVDGAATLFGSLAGDANTGALLGISHTGSVVLAAGASLSGAATSIAYPTILDAGVSLAVGANAKVGAAAGANALTITQQDGAVANQVVTIAAEATISGGSVTSAPTIYVAASAGGALITNAGTISSNAGNAYYTSTLPTVTNTSALVNAAGGVITDSSTSGNAAVNITGTATLQNAGVISHTGNSNAVYNQGVGAVVNTGRLTSATGAAYYASGVSTLTNSGAIASTGGVAAQVGAMTAVGAGRIINLAGGVITAGSASAAVYLTGTAAFQNAGSASNTGTGNAVANYGSGSVTNTGVISAVGKTTYTANGASVLSNSGTISNTAASNSQAVSLSGSASLQNTGVITSTTTGSTVFDGGAGAVTNGGRISGVGGSIVTLIGPATLTNTGVISNTGSGSGVTAFGGFSGNSTAPNTPSGIITNSGSITSTAKGISTVAFTDPGGGLVSTGTISASDRNTLAVEADHTTGSISVTLGAGSVTTGGIGGAHGGALAVTVAGALNGDIATGSAADTLRLVNGLSFTGTVNLGGGGDTLTLDGAAGSSTLAGSGVLSSVALVKAGAGAWALTGSGVNYTSVAFNGGVLELAAPNSAGAGAVTFGSGVQTLQLDMPSSGDFALANTLNGFGVEDVIDVRGATVTGATVSGDVLTLATSTGGTAVVTFASGTLSGRAVAVTADGAGGSFVTAGATVAPTPVTAPVAVAPTAVAAGQTVSLSPVAAVPTAASTAPVTVTGDVVDNGAAQIGGAGPVTYTGAVSGTGSLTVSTTSTVNLTGASTYTGATTVSAGTLLVNGSIANSAVAVGAGAVLGGSGTTGAVTAASGAVVSPGNSPGVLTTNGDLTLTAGAVLKEEVGGLANTAGATTFDQVNVTGGAFLNGATLNAVLYGGFAAPSTGSAALSIIHTTGGVSGTFAGLGEGAVFTLGGQQVQISYVGGANQTDVTLTFLATAAPTGGTAPQPAAAATSSQQLGFDTQVGNLIRLSPSQAGSLDPSSPLAAQLQAERAIAAQLDAGRLSAADAQAALFHLVDGTTSVAEISYAFFTGATPTAAGLGYLVNSSANTNNLNSAYYGQFTTENRYINFAANLATGSGAGASAFQANYGGLSLSDATAKAYAAVFGITASADKISAILDAQVSDGRGGLETRAQYLADITGGSPIAQKAAVVAFLLADSVKEGFGLYQQADQHFLQDLAHGAAAFNVDLLAAYTAPPALVGQTVADPTLGG